VVLRHPRAIRPWQHVLEPLSGYLLLAAKMLSLKDPMLCSSWNFGPIQEDMVCVETVVELFAQAWPNGSWRVVEGESLKETQVLRLNTEKAFRYLEWRPQWRLSQAVTRSAAWYRTFYQSSPSDLVDNMRRCSWEDIALYTATG
jgi:CDP-glucose 4,6-dehydratase